MLRSRISGANQNGRLRYRHAEGVQCGCGRKSVFTQVIEQDFARLIRSSQRYAGVMAATDDAGAYAQKLQQSGYATAPRYAEKLARIIETVARHTSAGLPQVVGNAADKRYGAA